MGLHLELMVSEDGHTIKIDIFPAHLLRVWEIRGHCARRRRCWLSIEGLLDMLK